jgi:hypothetical protein
MSLVRLLGFTTLTCGCVVGHYREVATSREVAYVEEKGTTCGSAGPRGLAMMGSPWRSVRTTLSPLLAQPFASTTLIA